ncbi:CRE-COH-1 protein [Caenorhabditis remanei]|uniref:CRE-COH-1 protein n=1 Tax=Caenorhabditis remanei TaxID=31234 RepID=E3LCV7_CAERE|nr:CRE-COH-1 protein [Caenorhabditis remanei]
MFYADFVLSKKGPLSKVWLAAHWEKKLSKAQICETDVNEAVNEIMKPKQNLALRTTGHLLLGICRVFSRKTKYLLADTNEAFLKIKLVFRNGALDQPNPVLPTFSMQDMYGEFGDNILPEFDDEELNHAPICQSRIDDITMKEDLPQNFGNRYDEQLEDDDFGEMAAGVQPEDYYRMMEDVNKEFDLEMSREAEEKQAKTESSLFGREREQTPALCEASAPGNTIFGDDDFSGNAHDDHDHDHDDMDHDAQGSSGFNDNNAMHIEDMDYDNGPNIPRDETPLRSETPMTPRASSPTPSVTPSVAPSVASTSQVEQDTVESYYERHAQKRALAKEQNMKKRRVDDVRMITGDEMKSNMADYSDLLIRLDLAPPTRKLTIAKRQCHADFLLHFPAMFGFSRSKNFVRDYQNCLTIRRHDDIEQKNEAIKAAVGLLEIGEEDLQQQQQEMDMTTQEEPQFADDFDDVAPLEFDNFENMMDMPQSMDDMSIPDDDVPQRNPLSPFADMTDDDDMGSAEKRRKLMDDKDDMEGDEDNRWSKRTHALLQSISAKLDANNGQIELDEMLKKGVSRKVAAAKFYSILCLKKNQCIDIEQKEPYGEINIRAGPNVDATVI